MFLYFLALEVGIWGISSIFKAIRNDPEFILFVNTLYLRFFIITNLVYLIYLWVDLDRIVENILNGGFFNVWKW